MCGSCSDSTKLTYAELFAGCGGLSEGFIESGFDCVAQVEQDEKAVRTLKIREAYHFLKSAGRETEYIGFLHGECKDLELMKKVPEERFSKIRKETISNENTSELAEWIKAQLAVRSKGELDVLAAGLPCQAYSLVGRSRGITDDDKRNYLYIPFLDVVGRLNPRMVVVENVPNMKSVSDARFFLAFCEGLQARGYRVNHEILNAKDYGVLQDRQRLFIVATRNDMNSDFVFPEKEICNSKLSELFGDIGGIDNKDYCKEFKLCSGYLKEKGIRKSGDVLTQHIAAELKNNPEQDREIYRLCIEYLKRTGNHLHYCELPDYLRTHKNQNEKQFQDRYKVLDPNGISHTITRHIAKDGHNYIYPDTNQCRSISVREAARVQSFPDDYYFCGGKTSSFCQIGNAVPPLLSRALAESVRNYLLQAG